MNAGRGSCGPASGVHVTIVTSVVSGVNGYSVIEQGFTAVPRAVGVLVSGGVVVIDWSLFRNHTWR